MLEVHFLHLSIWMRHHHIVETDLTRCISNNPHTSVTQIKRQVAVTLSVPVIAVPLFLPIRVVSRHMTVKYRVGIISQIKESIAPFEPLLPAWIKILEDIPFLSGSVEKRWGNFLN